MSEAKPIVAVIAGGAGSRLGGSKPATELAGRPLIAWPLQAAAAAGLEAIVVAKPATELPALEVPVVRESDPLTHPLTGILAALESHPARPILALACDLPFIPPALLRELAAADGPATIEAGGRMQPLIARYDPAAAPAIRTALCRGEAAGSLLARLEPLVISGSELSRFGDSDLIAFNVNTPEQLAEAERRLA
jgi:molybdopterin-guanine dinucleotide biosynthesis protein A